MLIEIYLVEFIDGVCNFVTAQLFFKTLLILRLSPAVLTSIPVNFINYNHLQAPFLRFPLCTVSLRGT